MKEIKLTQGKVTLVDDEDYEELNAFKWCARKDTKNGSYYAERALVLELHPKFKTKCIKMHRCIMEEENPKIHIDHKDGNTLNNTRQNLRVATPTQNGANRTKGSKSNTSGFRGVSFKKSSEENKTGRTSSVPRKQWVAQVNANGKRVTIGYFETPEEAAQAFDNAAKKYYGEFCGKLNFE